MHTPHHPPAETRAEPYVEITLRRPPTGGGWQADVSIDGRHLHFDTLLMLIGWLSRLEAPPGGIR